MSKMTSDNYPRDYWENGREAGLSSYQNYGDDPGWFPTANILADVLEPWAAVLEVGCAMGYFVQAARRAGLNAYGIDISEYAVNKAPVEVEEYVSVQNAAMLPDSVLLQVANFDAVVSWEMLEHVPENEIDAVLNNMEDMVQSSGLMIHRICLDIGDNYAHADDDHTHVTIESREWWEAKFEARGWSHVAGIEERFDEAFEDRDWKGRFFAWKI